MQKQFREKLDSAIIQLSQLKAIDEGQQNQVFSALTESVSDALGKERVSIWLFNSENTGMSCSDLYDSRTKNHSSGMFLEFKDHPEYFKAISTGEILCCIEVEKSPEVKSMLESYLKPRNIISMLDTPIFLDQKLIGVICVECIEEIIEGTYIEESFLHNVANIISRSILALEKCELLKALGQKMEVVAEVTHEINNPLSLIKTNADYLLELLEKGELSPSELRNSLQTIQSTSSRIEKMIKELRKD